MKAAQAPSRRDDDVISIKSDIALIKWMLGVVIAFVVAITIKLFVH